METVDYGSYGWGSEVRQTCLYGSALRLTNYVSPNPFKLSLPYPYNGDSTMCPLGGPKGQMMEGSKAPAQALLPKNTETVLTCNFLTQEESRVPICLTSGHRKAWCPSGLGYSYTQGKNQPALAESQSSSPLAGALLPRMGSETHVGGACYSPFCN